MSDSTVQKTETRFIVLVRGLMERGGFYWCYLAIKPNLITKFQKAIANKYNIQNFVKDAYGEVVVSGRGRTPPQEVTEKVAQMFEIPPKELAESDPNIRIKNILSQLEKDGQLPQE